VSSPEGQDNHAYTPDDTKRPNDVEMNDWNPPPSKSNTSGPVEGGEEEEYVFQQKDFDPDEYPSCCRAIYNIQQTLCKFYTEHKCVIWRVFAVICLIAYLVYFALAMNYEFGDEGSIRLLVCTIFGLLLLVLHLTKHHFAKCTQGIDNFLELDMYKKQRRIIRWVLYVVSTVGMVTLIIVLVALDKPKNLWSLAGLAALIIICFVTSYNPGMVDWHPVFWGFSVQFYFAVIILKTQWGYDTFDWLGARVTEFLAYSDAGAKFVFGDYASVPGTLSPKDGSAPIEGTLAIQGAYTIHFFATKIMPVVVFFSTVIAILYHLGIMQVIIRVIGKFLAFCLGTTAPESLNAAGNIFVAMTESPLMIRPFLRTMTRSELHAVMTGGFATIAGSVLGVYIEFGVPADHLLSASVMSAPAALAISKLTYPEVEVPVIDKESFDKSEKTEEGSVIEAACTGAMKSATIVASILVNVIAFLSILEFINATLMWLGERVGKDDLTFEYICSYVLYPVALFMGTEPDDCRQVAELIGVKTFTNEFIAYQRLKGLLDNRQVLDAYNGTWHNDGDDIVLDTTGQTLEKGVLSERSELIATYALCGFSNMGSMGILLGTLSAMVPARRSTMAKLVVRAMIAGNIACFFTACIAGLFFEDHDD